MLLVTVNREAAQALQKRIDYLHYDCKSCQTEQYIIWGRSAAPKRCIVRFDSFSAAILYIFDAFGYAEP